MLSEALQEVKRVYLEIEQEGRVPTYSGDIVTGNIMIMRSLNEAVLYLNPLKVPYASISWLFRVLGDPGLMRGKVRELVRMAVVEEWNDRRLMNEYELRIGKSNEHELLDAKRSGDLYTFFCGARAAMRCFLNEVNGDFVWPSGRSFTDTPNENKDLLHEKAQANYHVHHDNALYTAAKASLGLDDSPYHDIVVTAMIDAGIAYSGSPYYSDEMFFSALKFLNLPFTAECEAWLTRFKKRMVI